MNFNNTVTGLDQKTRNWKGFYFFFFFFFIIVPCQLVMSLNDHNHSLHHFTDKRNLNCWLQDLTEKLA